MTTADPRSPVTWERRSNVLVIRIDNPPVNAIGVEVRKGLQRALEHLETEASLSHVVLTGREQVFAAGGDTREFDGPPHPPHLPDICNAIEASAVPFVAALSGATLGGGCELALACRLRVAAPDLKIGLPEVTIGVVPGAGGTQRLPRLIGMAQALDLITTGRPLSARDALSLGLIDHISDDQLVFAMTMERDALDARTRVGDRAVASPDDIDADTLRSKLEQKFPGQVAPLRALELVRQSARLPLHDGMAEERTAFLTLRASAQARALRHITFAERGAKAPGWLTDAPKDLNHVAVVGGGLMGSGIAFACLRAGLRVTVIETDAERAETAEARIMSLAEGARKRGLIDQDGMGMLRSRLTTTYAMSDAADADLAIEAAIEDLTVKQAIMMDLEAVLRRDAVLATNTSYLDLDAIAAATAIPERVLGLHFFAPAHIMKLLEIVRGAATGNTALATGFALARRLKKVPVLSGVCDGFIGNRILARYREATDSVLLEGATPYEVDAAMRSFGYAMGPYEAQDMSGLDIAYANRRRQDATRDPARPYVRIADRMVEAGRLGRKSGAGWYRYGSDGSALPDDEVLALIETERQAAGLTGRSLAHDAIQMTALAAMINEACDILHEGIAEDARAIDLVTVFGYGFPRWRGGLMHHADTIGVARIAALIRAQAERDSLSWRISPVLEACERDGTTLADYRRVQ